jgi:regulator of nucleoside diphosphate kinase
MTQKPVNSGKLPTIIVSEAEHDHLTSLAEKGSRSAPDAASMLNAEMQWAIVVPSDKIPDRVVRMGSKVEFKFDSGQPREVTLVYPAKANIAEGRISVLTPIGAALIGLAEGQSITWKAVDGRLHKLMVLRVASPASTREGTLEREANVVNFLPRSRGMSGDTPNDPDDDDPGPRAA